MQKVFWTPFCKAHAPGGHYLSNDLISERYEKMTLTGSQACSFPLRRYRGPLEDIQAVFAKNDIRSTVGLNNVAMA
jgi:hypothetical protein